MHINNAAIRQITHNGQPYYNLTDICNALDLYPTESMAYLQAKPQTRPLIKKCSAWISYSQLLRWMLAPDPAKIMSPAAIQFANSLLDQHIKKTATNGG